MYARCKAKCQSSFYIPTVWTVKVVKNEARRLYNVNYGSSIIYVKSLSNNVSNENIKTGVSREMIFKR